jgi:phospholipase/carboxylesterase
MHALSIDPEVIRWSVDGAPAAADAAHAALADRPLLVLMHGLGSNEGDLMGLAPALPRGLVCASLRAPLAAPPAMSMGFTWFPLSLQANESAPDRITDNAAWQAAQAVLMWLDDIDSTRDSPVACALLGFSQGGVMATTLIRCRPTRFLAAVNCSGFTATGEFPGDSELETLRPAVFWGSDPQDPVIGAEAIARTAAWLPSHATLEARTYPGIAHSISREELDDIFMFLSKNVPGAVPIR